MWYWDLRVDRYSSISTDAALHEMISRYASTRRPIRVDFRRLVPCLPSPDRATHLLHPYPAKLLVHIPFFFLANEMLSRRGDTVLDPFCGSGTVPLEAGLAGRKGLGTDLNPLATLVASVKTRRLDPGRLRAACSSLLSRVGGDPSGPTPDVVNLNHWFYPHVIRELRCILDAIRSTRCREYRRFFLVCFSSCVRKVSLADPRLSVPVRLRPGKYPVGHRLRGKMARHLRALRTVRVKKVFAAVLQANCRRMSALAQLAAGEITAKIFASDARDLRYGANSNGRMSRRLSRNSVQLIVTSPPYPGAQKYIRSSSLCLGWLGMCPSQDLISYKRRTIGREEFAVSERQSPPATGLTSADRLVRALHGVDPTRAAIAATYLCEMREALTEAHRVLRPGGHLALVVGNNQICQRQFRTQNYLRLIAEQIGFEVVLRMVDTIRSRGLMTKRNKSAGVITREWVLLFRKGG